jgi:TonB family protein
VPALLGAPCTSRDLEKVNSSLYWLVSYPDRATGPGSGLPSLNTYVVPKYTEAACAVHWRGAILARIDIDDAGTPKSVTLMSSPGFGIDQAVSDALQGWRFSPATNGGRPVPTSSIIEFDFGHPRKTNAAADTNVGKLSAPTVVVKTAPAFPMGAPARTQQGPVVLRIVVDEQGGPCNIRVGRSIGRAWDERAIQAVQNWRFRPGTMDGHPIAMEATVAISF